MEIQTVRAAGLKGFDAELALCDLRQEGFNFVHGVVLFDVVGDDRMNALFREEDKLNLQRKPSNV